MISRIWKVLLSGLLAICLDMAPSTSDRALAQLRMTGYLLVPDYIGQKITIQTFEQGSYSLKPMLKFDQVQPNIYASMPSPGDLHPMETVMRYGQRSASCSLLLRRLNL